MLADAALIAVPILVIAVAAGSHPDSERFAPIVATKWLSVADLGQREAG